MTKREAQERVRAAVAIVAEKNMGAFIGVLALVIAGSALRLSLGIFAGFALASDLPVSIWWGPVIGIPAGVALDRGWIRVRRRSRVKMWEGLAEMESGPLKQTREKDA